MTSASTPANKEADIAAHVTNIEVSQRVMHF
jgi:hypothetical protein